VRAEGHRLGKCLDVPRALLQGIEREPDVWRALREQVVDGALVDFQREMLLA